MAGKEPTQHYGPVKTALLHKRRDSRRTSTTASRRKPVSAEVSRRIRDGAEIMALIHVAVAAWFHAFMFCAL